VKRTFVALRKFSFLSKLLGADTIMSLGVHDASDSMFYITLIDHSPNAGFNQKNNKGMSLSGRVVFHCSFWREFSLIRLVNKK
jgi:hypothetical protein